MRQAMRTIRLMASTCTHSDSVALGSQSTTFLPSIESIPDIDFQSLSGSSAGFFCLASCHCLHAVDDGMISNQTIVYPGDPQVIAPSHIVLRVARAGLFCTMNYSTKYCSDFLELAEDPPAIEVIYLHKYFQIFIYFIRIDSKI